MILIFVMATQSKPCSMKVLSFNCRGVNEFKKCYLRTLLLRCDVLFIQEHWQTDAQISDLNAINSDFCVHGVCGFDQNEVLQGRPYGGCAIFLAPKS